MTRLRSPTLILCIALVGCGSAARLAETASTGPDPQLPPPDKSLIPTVHVAEAKGWPAGGAPVGAQGTRVAAFATGLSHPRWVYVLPNGDVLVAEGAAPARPEEGKGLKAKAMGFFMKKAGSSVPSAIRSGPTMLSPT